MRKTAMPKTRRCPAAFFHAAVLLAAIAVGCAGKPAVSDTGYAGTWGHGNDRIRSTLSIVREGNGWRARISVRSSDGTYAMRSGWDGRGESVQDGAKTYDLVFRTQVDAGSGRLRVECTGTPVAPTNAPVHYVDELVVEPGGLTLSAYTLERGEQRFEEGARPHREFRKVSDGVKDAPPARAAP
jgi:hypothetical protein